MAELTKQKPESSRFNGSSQVDGGSGTAPEVVKGTYQPVGKVDIAALRAQAQKTQDDRPTLVKGAYEPVGKVDIAAIKAKAQKPGEGARQHSPVATGMSATSNTSDEPKSLADRSAAFSQSERLTALPKPKIANKFGSNTSSFTGTKAPTPGAYGLQSTPTGGVPPSVGAASRTFADEGGKTPAQIWAEKKARQGGSSGAGIVSPSIASPIKDQTSGGGEWKSGYSGKSWAPVATTKTGRSATSSIGQQRTGEVEDEQEDAPTSPSGGIGALRDRFKGGVPMGAPSNTRATTGEQSPPDPTVPTSTRPGGIPMPGLPTRPAQNDDEDQDGPNIPPPPRVQRSPTPPTPERDTSPVRIAMPVARSKEPEIKAPEERNEPPALPSQAIGRTMPDEDDLTEEPAGHDPARGAGVAMAAASFGQNATSADQGAHASGKRALVQYDYEKAEDNELELTEGDYVTNIEMVDEDWWMGTNSKGESGLFPSNYVELVEDGEEDAPAPLSHEPAPVAPAAAPVPAAAHSSPSGPTANALYDYEAAEDNELSFPEGATVTGLVRISSISRSDR